MIGAVLQARMGSTRLPGKVLMTLAGRPLLSHILERLALVNHTLHPVIATTTANQDDALIEFAGRSAVDCFRGSEENVLERYVLCVRHYGFSHVVRLTGDNPFTDIEELDHLITRHLENAADYTSSCPALPTGVGAEIFASAALERSLTLADQAHHFEHVNEYILEHRADFKCKELVVPSEKRHPGVRLTVDTEADFQRANFICQNASSWPVTTVEAIYLAKSYGES